MAAKKKVKKRAAKTSVKKRTKTSSTSVKKAKVTKKKNSAKSSSVSAKRSGSSSVKKSQVGSKLSKAKSAVKNSPSNSGSYPTSSKTKLFSKKYSPGVRVQAITGRYVGQTGVVVRQDSYLCTIFVAFDRYQNDPLYKTVEWGPYFESELGLLNKRSK